MCRSISPIAPASPAARRRNLFSKRARPVAAIHYRNRSHSVQSRDELGAEGGNGELQIEGARRGAVARQEARANSASRPSCRRIDSQGVARVAVVTGTTSAALSNNKEKAAGCSSSG